MTLRAGAVLVVMSAFAVSCGGEDGKDGKDAIPYLTQTVPASAADCPNGGTNVLTGPDTNRSGSLDIGEILSTATICNGGDGEDGDPTTVWLTSAEDAGPETCDWGGTVLHFGKDLNANDVLETGEYLSSRAVCKSPINAVGASAVWSGAGTNALWSNPANWQDGVAPIEGQSLTFPAVATSKVNRNDLQRLFAINVLTVNEGYTLEGNQLTVLGGVQLAGGTATSEIALPLFVRCGGTCNVQVADSTAEVDLLISGAISGPASSGITKVGSGRLVLTGSNTYGSRTGLSAGTLRVDGGHAIPDTGLFLTTGGVLEIGPAGETIGDFEGSGSTTTNLIGDLTIVQTQSVINYGGVLNGAGAYIHRGVGLFQTLSGSGTTHTGPLVIDEGGFIVTGTHGASPVHIGNGGALGGSGNVGPITVEGSGEIVPGDADPGILTVSGNLTLTPGTTLSTQLKGTTVGSGYSRLSATGNVNLGGAILEVPVNFTPANGNAFTVVQCGGTLSGTFAGLPDLATISAGGFTFSVDYTSNSVVLTKLP